MWGNAPSYYLAREDLIDSLKECAQEYLENFADWYAHNPDELPYILLVMTSSDDELRELLSAEDTQGLPDLGGYYHAHYEYYRLEKDGRYIHAKCSLDEDDEKEIPAELWQYMLEVMQITQEEFDEDIKEE